MKIDNSTENLIYYFVGIIVGVIMKYYWESKEKKLNKNDNRLKKC